MRANVGSISLPILSNAELIESDRAAASSLTTNRPRLPEWLRISLPTGEARQRYNVTLDSVKSNALHTVCEEARCPNIHDCWGRGTATFMIAGKSCTRGCRFCAVDTIKAPPPVDPMEPEHLAAAVENMKLSYVVVTVVNRDDMPDGGASHYRDCVLGVNQRLPHVGIELLCSDLGGNYLALESLLHALPLKVFAHNVECVERLDRAVRDPRASFAQSLEILRRARELRPDIPTKSSIMIGLGETDEEVTDAMHRLRSAGVELLTLGQYLAPSDRHMPVDRFVPPEIFAQWDREARAMGFKAVASGPLVRSSFRAGLLFEETKTGIRSAPDPLKLGAARPAM